MAAFELSQREVDSIMEQLDDVYHRIEDCEDSYELRGYATALRQAARMCEYLASDYDKAADKAEEDTCPDCGTGLCATCGECPACGNCCVYEEDGENG